MSTDPIETYSKRVYIATLGQVSREMALLENPTRRAIIYLLATHGPQTLKDISDKLKLAPSTVYEHLRKLKEAGFISEASEYPKRFKVEIFYKLEIPFILASETQILQERLLHIIESIKNNILKALSGVESELKEIGLKYIHSFPKEKADEMLKRVALVLVTLTTYSFLYELTGGSIVYALVNDMEEVK